MPRPWVFLHLAIIAGLMGFGQIAAAVVDAAKALFFVFAALFVGRLLITEGRRGEALRSRRR